jgi:hypothetical protein
MVNPPHYIVYPQFPAPLAGNTESKETVKACGSPNNYLYKNARLFPINADHMVNAENTDAAFCLISL